MIAASCPRCAESIRVPSTAMPDDAYAHCPLCRETFSFSELADRLPPAVQVFGADGQPIEAIESPVMLANQEDISGGASRAATMAAGAAAVGAAALGFSGNEESSEVDLSAGGELDEIEEFVDEELESDVEEFLDNAAAVETATSSDDASPESTVLMDTLQMDSAEVDVEEEVVQFTGEETVGDEADQIEFVSDGLERDTEMLVEEVDLEEELASEPISAEQNKLPPVAAQTVRARPAPRRRKGSPIKMILGVLLGPLLALPLAGGILLALGKAPDLGFWPFLGNGNSLSSRIAASPVGSNQPGPAAALTPNAGHSDGFARSEQLVPADSDVGEFVRDNAAAMAIPPNDEIPAPNSTNPNPTAPALPGPEDGPEDTGVDSKGASDSDAPSFAWPPKTDATASESQAEAEEAKRLEELERAAKERIRKRRMEESAKSVDTIFETPIPIAAPGSKTDSPPAPAVATSAQPEMLRDLKKSEEPESPFGAGVSLSGPASFDDEETVKAAAKVTDSLVTLATRKANGEATDRDLARTYRDVCMFAAQMHELSSTSTSKLMREISESSFLDDFEGKIIPQWIGYSRRPTDGILLIGVVDGTPNAATLKLSNGESVPIALSNGNPIRAIGARVVAIGKILSDNSVVVSSAVAIAKK